MAGWCLSRLLCERGGKLQTITKEQTNDMCACSIQRIKRHDGEIRTRQWMVRSDRIHILATLLFTRMALTLRNSSKKRFSRYTHILPNATTSLIPAFRMRAGKPYITDFSDINI